MQMVLAMKTLRFLLPVVADGFAKSGRPVGTAGHTGTAPGTLLLILWALFLSCTSQGVASELVLVDVHGYLVSGSDTNARVQFIGIPKVIGFNSMTSAGYEFSTPEIAAGVGCAGFVALSQGEFKHLEVTAGIPGTCLYDVYVNGEKD